MIANIVGYIKSDIVGLKNLFLEVGQPKAILKNKNPFTIKLNTLNDGANESLHALTTQ